MRVIGLLSALALVACGGEDDLGQTPGAIDLRAHIGNADVTIVGVTIAPDTGRRFVLDASNGVYEITADGSVVELMALLDFPEPDVPVVGTFTDIAALGSDRFAITATNDGYILDLNEHTLTQHFCYLPDDLPFEQEVYQLTHSLAYDPAAGYLYAQPQTLAVEDNALMGSSVGTFDPTSGDDLRWVPLLDPTFIAGAVTVETPGVLLFGQGTATWRFDLDAWTLTQAADLASHGIGRIEGLAIDTRTDSLLIVDGADQTLTEISRIPAAE